MIAKAKKAIDPAQDFTEVMLLRHYISVLQKLMRELSENYSPEIIATFERCLEALDLGISSRHLLMEQMYQVMLKQAFIVRPDGFCQCKYCEAAPAMYPVGVVHRRGCLFYRYNLFMVPGVRRDMEATS